MRHPHADGGHSRRDFLAAAGAAALAAGGLNAATRRDANCIFLLLVGGPSQIDTWDPKPSAPSDHRGPFSPIRTNVTGVHLGEHFPLMAQRAGRFAVVRSVYHDAAPIHETGHQLVQTGHLFAAGVERPYVGAELSAAKGRRGSAPAFAVVPGPVENTGVGISHGQTAADLGAEHAPAFISPRQKGFAASCREAVRLVEGGTRFVAVNMFDSVFNEVTWDCHADGGSLATTLDDYASTLCPMFDRAYCGLLDALHEKGMLDSTLVVAAGEFGRTPRVNGRGGRDHWPGVWSVLFAGGGVRGGQAVGASDRLGAEPKDRPVAAADIAATVRHAVGLPAQGRVIEELFR